MQVLMTVIVPIMLQIVAKLLQTFSLETNKNNLDGLIKRKIRFIGIPHNFSLIDLR